MLLMACGSACLIDGLRPCRLFFMAFTLTISFTIALIMHIYKSNADTRTDKKRVWGGYKYAQVLLDSDLIIWELYNKAIEVIEDLP